MSTLKKFFPYSFGAASVSALVIKIIVYICLPAILGVVTGIVGMLLGEIPVIGAIITWALGVISSVIGLYSLIGIVLLVLDYLKVLKD